MNKSFPNSISDLTTSDRNKLFDDEDSTEEEMEENLITSSKVLSHSDSLERFGELPVHRKNSNKSTESPKMKAREIVVDHPLEGARSSLSDDDADDMLTSPKLTSTPSTIQQTGSRTSAGKRMNRLHNFIATNLDESHNENQGYYNTASTLWNHRSKLLNTFKKQVASHGTWSFTSQQQAASSTTTTTDVMPATEKELVTIGATTTTTSPGSRSMPSISLYDNAADSEVDDGAVADSEEDSSPTEPHHQSASSFLHELRTKVPQVFAKKYENLTSSAATTTTVHEQQQHQATATSSGENTTTVNTSTGSPIMLKKRSDSKTSSFAVSLSSLLHKRKSSDDVIDDSDDVASAARQQDGDKEEGISPPPPPHSKMKEERDVTATTTTATTTTPDDVITAAAASRENQVTVEWLMRMTCVIFIYCIIPFPASFILVVKGFIVGVASCILFLALFRPSHPPRGRVSAPPGTFNVNRDVPEKIPHGLYDIKQPMKGWMNEIKNYEIESYHVSNTTSVFVTIDNNALRIQTPLKNISRRGSYKEGKILLSQVLTQRIFNLNHAQVFLQPEELVSKRIWSKKYPICVQIKTRQQQAKQTRKSNNENSDTDSVTSHNGGDEDDVTTLYLFGRTCRQKEEWFYKIQQAINLCRISAAAGGDHAKCVESLKDEWQILDEKEDPVQTCLPDMEILNENPQKILQDYYLQMTRLLPDVSNQCVPEKDEVKTEESQNRGADRIKQRDGGRLDESDLQVSWMNVLVGRIMFDFFRQSEWTNRLFTRVQKKLDKIKLPYFVSGLKLIEMNLGSSAPLIHQISLPRIDKQGIWVEAEITYHGSFQMALETYMVLTKLGKCEQNETQEKQNKMNAIVHSEAEDSAESTEEEEGENQPTQSMTDRLVQAVVGTQNTTPKPSGHDVASGGGGAGNSASTSSVASQPQQQQPKKWVRYLDQLTKSRYFKKATENQYIRRKLETISHTPVLLTVELLQMHGVVTINIPPPPSDRIWYGFREPPEIELKAFPKLGERLISIFHVTELIEQKLKQEFIKLLVLPNMEDLQIPLLFSNRSHR